MLTEMAGQRYGMWTVKHYVETRKKKALWECVCDCGTTRNVAGSSLRSGVSRSCGCGEKFHPQGSRDLTGKIFGKWTVVSRAHYKTYQFWNCRCECGSTRAVQVRSLLRGQSTSCGCQRAKVQHGWSGTKLYSVWQAMRARCSSPNSSSYRNYGARGISVCERWDASFENFLADMGDRPSDDFEIDRIDNDGNYEPLNCRWVSRSDNNRNKRNNRTVKYRGRTELLSDVCERYEHSVSTVSYRTETLGWPLEIALFLRPISSGL